LISRRHGGIREAADEFGRFVRCSSEFPFLPGVQKVWRFLRENSLGPVIEIRSGFWHASDLDPAEVDQLETAEQVLR
jgi:hypothetical protein